MNLFIENKCFNGDALITERNQLFYRKTIGFRDNENQEKLIRNSIFNVGSVSKPFTSVAILQLQEKKLLSIEDPVKKYLPSFPYENVCIKHLLSHTSGLPANIDFLDEADYHITVTNDSIIGMLVKYKPPLKFAPGEQWNYSNMGYDLLAVIVERVSKMKFDEYMRKNIFGPAKMTRTFVPRTQDIKRWLPKKLTEKDIALPHDFENIAACSVRNIYPGIIKSTVYFYGSSNVYTTVYDLDKFDQALSDNSILSKSSQLLAYSPYQLNNGNFAVDSLAPILSYYGLGWDVSVDTSWGKIVWHKGRSGGTRAVFLRNISRHQMAAFLDNNDNPNTDLKAVACLKIINHQPYKNPINMSLVQILGCEIGTLGYDSAYKRFVMLRETKRQNYFVSRDELNELAITLDGKKNLKDALSVINLANQLYPDNWEIMLTHADLLLKNKQVEQSITTYKKVVPLYGNNESERIDLLGNIGSQYIDASRLSDAEVVLKLNTEIFPEDCNSYDNYAFILDKNNKLDQAIEVQEKAVELATEHNDKLLETLKQNLNNLKAKK
jgi:CubicO group peptidase (beta-lactamase class C family)